MSSAILYVAIVAIWIGVLVPRWLKRENSSSGLGRLSRHFGAAQAEDEDEAGRAGFDPDGRPRYTSFVPSAEAPEGAGAAPGVAPGGQTHASVPHSKPRSNYTEEVSPADSGNKKSMTELPEAQAPRPAVPSYGWSADEVARQERVEKTPEAGAEDVAVPDAQPAPGTQEPAQAEVRMPTPRGPHHDEPGDSERRAQIVRGRRRMLWLLLILTAVGVGLAYLQLAAWWVMIPPTVLLIGYLLLLREAAHADAEARQRRSTAPATAAAPAAPASAGEALQGGTEAEIPVEETGPRADIIDLSEHVDDQLYDQYADAKLRAVGD